jgi:hypothetical protein
MPIFSLADTIQTESIHSKAHLAISAYRRVPQDSRFDGPMYDRGEYGASAIPELLFDTVFATIAADKRKELDYRTQCGRIPKEVVT